MDSKVKIDVAIEALVWADQMLTARDEMNSKVNCAPVRLSPITERIKQALALLIEESRESNFGEDGSFTKNSTAKCN